VLIPYPLDLEQSPFNAAERRNARMVADADAVVVVRDGLDPVVADLLGWVVREGIPYRVLAVSDTR
jgi:hypothetical protein